VRLKRANFNDKRTEDETRQKITSGRALTPSDEHGEHGEAAVCHSHMPDKVEEDPSEWTGS
jgi:hypothetical protein